MITQLTINNFAIVDQLSVDFLAGMTAITGETGAGKSIAIDALGLCLGDRADAAVVRTGAERADISAHFILDDTPSALTWLTLNQLDDDNECILRRVINFDGRSKAFINGRPVPISQLKELGQLLIQIHGQHEHQRLLKPEYQQILLNQYMGETALLQPMQTAYRVWREAKQQYAEYEKAKSDREAHRQLLSYQLKELDEFSPQLDEYQQIDEEYKRLANSEQLISLGQQVLLQLADNDEYNVLSLLNSSKNQLHELVGFDNQLSDVLTMVEEATIQINEASHELRNYAERLETDPRRVMQLEERIAKYLSLARKHHIAPEQLVTFHQQLQNEFADQLQYAEAGETLKLTIEQYYQKAQQLAQQLHKKRSSSASNLSKQVTTTLQELAMPNAKFMIEVIASERLTEDGFDQVTFMVTTNPGQPLQSIAKVASGGELSRMALAIQVLTAQKSDTPALIFDEIDTGISGATAAKVGHLLRELGQSTQVITVTHLPQVAGQANQHYYVAKQISAKKTLTKMLLLDHEGRRHELARLLGGDKITENTLANAKELLLG